MEREARASFRVIRINRWSLAAVLLAILGVLLYPLGRRLPLLGEPRVRPGVTLLGRSMAGLTEDEVRAVVQDLARSLETGPASSPGPAPGPDRAAPATAAPAPGFQVDVEATVLRVMTAPRGEAVLPAWTPVRPAGASRAQPDLPVHSGDPARQAVALVINVAWGTEYLPEMLTALKRAGARATFLVTGRWAEKNQNLLRTIAAGGHEIGNHGYDDRRSPLEMHRTGQLRADIERADRIIREITGRAPRFYQPHRGEWNREVVRLARELGYTTVMWSLDTRDWMPGVRSQDVLREVGKARAGDIILLHPTDPTRRALPAALDTLRQKGLRTVTLAEILPQAGSGTSPQESGAPGESVTAGRRP